MWAEYIGDLIWTWGVKIKKNGRQRGLCRVGKWGSDKRWEIGENNESIFYKILKELMFPDCSDNSIYKNLEDLPRPRNTSNRNKTS